MRLVAVLVSLLLLLQLVEARECQSSDEWNSHPVLCRLVQWISASETHVEEFATFAHAWAKKNKLLAGESLESHSSIRSRSLSASSFPLVFAHGMGDSCFNSGFQHLVDHTKELINAPSAQCIPTGDNKSQDTKNGYFLNMDASVDIFAAKVQQDENLRDGFYAIGLSQGNNVIRGYITRYNDPPVRGFISINGVNGGVGAVPYCIPKSEQTQEITLAAADTLNNDIITLFEAKLGLSMCDLLMEQASRAAYTTYAQEHSFQANYWRDPRPVAQPLYQQYSQLAKWNNEVPIDKRNSTFNENWQKTDKFIWVEALQDEMVWPHQGEQWGAADPANPFEHVLERHETEWYKQDLFGLRTAEEAGKNYYESFEGDHLQFTMEDYDNWVITYFT